MKANKNFARATNQKMNKAFLTARTARMTVLGYDKPKWIIFCETMIEKGFDVVLYEARKTYSKYITVSKDDKSFKVRFSNHKPIKRREKNGHCDFFVGRCNNQTTTTDQAIEATLKYFKEQ